MRKEQWVLVTGASGGIGSAISVELAKRGYHLYLQYRNAQEDAQRTKLRCEGFGVPVILIRADLESIEEINGMFDQMARLPDILINNAGTTHYGMFTDTSLDDFETLHRVNVRAPFLLTQKVVPYMVRQRFGRVINISSIWGVTGASCEVLYSMTKGAVLSFTKALAKELAPCNVTVNAVVPGAVEGNLLNRQFSPSEQELIASEIPMGRLGKPEEIASLVCYLLKPEAEYITGQVISPNGGWYT
jgi:3-oxoacyl-[acyl-carrier protein] reductase